MKGPRNVKHRGLLLMRLSARKALVVFGILVQGRLSWIYELMGFVMLLL